MQWILKETENEILWVKWAASISTRISRVKQMKLLFNVKLVSDHQLLATYWQLHLVQHAVIRRFLMDQSMLSLDSKVDSKTKGVCIRLFSFIGWVFRVDSSLILLLHRLLMTAPETWLRKAGISGLSRWSEGPGLLISPTSPEGSRQCEHGSQPRRKEHFLFLCADWKCVCDISAYWLYPLWNETTTLKCRV